MTARILLALGAFSGALAVAAGAFGAHALRARLDARMLEVFETAARYQMYHALALFAVAFVALRAPSATTAVQVSGWGFVLGTLLFSGSLYAMALTGIRGLGAITPLGGVCFIAGWVALGLAALKLEG